MHTNSSKLQAEIIAQDMSYEKLVEKARAIELTKKEVDYMKQTEEGFKVEASAVDALRRESKFQFKGDTQPGSKLVRFRDQPSCKSQGNRQSKNCQRCGDQFTDQHDCRARNVTSYKFQRSSHFARMCKTKNTVDYLQGTPEQEEDDFDSVEFELDPIETPVIKKENNIFSSKQYPSTNVNL